MKRFQIVICLLIIYVMISFPSNAGSAQQQTIRIAAFNFYPTLFQAKDGSVQGFYVDFLQEIAKREGWKIEYIYGSWADGLARIKSGDVDVLTNVAFTRERSEFMDYGKVPLLTVWAELYVVSGSRIDSIRDVRGKKVALMKGDFNAANFKNLVEKLEIPCTYVEFGNFEEVFKAISTGQVDAGVVNNTFGAAKQREYNVQSSGVVFNPFDIFFTVAKDKNSQVLATLDRYLAEWRKVEDSPYHKARERWSHKNVSTIKVTPASIRRIIFVFAVITGVAVIFGVVLRIQVRRRTSELKIEIAERKVAEEAAKESEARYHTLIDQAPDAIVLYDIDTDKFVDANPSAEKLFGCSRKDLLHYGPRDFYSSQQPDQREVSESISEHNQQGLAGDQVYFERAVKTADGRSLVCEVRLVGFPSEGKRLLRGSFIDITERKKVEERFAWLAAVVEYTDDAIITKNMDGVILSWNKGAERLFGYREEEVLGKPVTILIPAELLSEEGQFLQKLSQGEHIDHYETVRLAKDGSHKNVSLTVSPIMSKSGEVIGASKIARDITLRKQLEAQLLQSQRMEAIGQLAGGVAHDFNNILQVIMGYGSIMLMDENLDDEQKEKIENILVSADKASQLTKSLLAFSRKQVMKIKKANLNTIVLHIQKFLVRIIGEDVQLKLIVNEPELPVCVDSGQVDQVLINLATNARDAMPKGGLLTIETTIKDIDEHVEHAHGIIAPGRYACITVSDTGNGMDKETSAKIFEPFFTTKDVGKGTGLGMAIVHGIVKQHNGYITAYSEPGHGTTFKVYLPLAEAGQVTDEEKVAQAMPRRGTETILLAEDDETVRELEASLLKNFGYEVISAVDGQDAVEKFIANRESIKLILMDVIMPRKNGKEVYAEISQLQPGVKVLFASGYTAEFIQNRGAWGESVNLLMKPVQPMELLRTVREILDS